MARESRSVCRPFSSAEIEAAARAIGGCLDKSVPFERFAASRLGGIAVHQARLALSAAATVRECGSDA